MHGEMTRLNRLISQNKALQEKLASATFNQEKEFVAELRELETQSVQRDTQVRRLQTERAQILEDIVESERQLKRMIKEMELAIDKRETIAVRNRGRKKTGYTKASMNQRISQLRKMQASTVKDSRRCAAC